MKAWSDAQDLVAHAVALSHPCEGYAVLIIAHASSDENWSSFLMKVPQVESDNGMAVEDMSHKPLEVLSDFFHNLQLRWPTVEKQAFAFVSTVGWSIFCGLVCTVF